MIPVKVKSIAWHAIWTFNFFEINYDQIYLWLNILITCLNEIMVVIDHKDVRIILPHILTYQYSFTQIRSACVLLVWTLSFSFIARHLKTTPVYYHFLHTASKVSVLRNFFIDVLQDMIFKENMRILDGNMKTMHKNRKKLYFPQKGALKREK